MFGPAVLRFRNALCCWFLPNMTPWLLPKQNTGICFQWKHKRNNSKQRHSWVLRVRLNESVLHRLPQKCLSVSLPFSVSAAPEIKRWGLCLNPSPLPPIHISRGPYHGAGSARSGPLGDSGFPASLALTAVMKPVILGLPPATRAFVWRRSCRSAGFFQTTNGPLRIFDVQITRLKAVSGHFGCQGRERRGKNISCQMRSIRLKC